MSKDLFGSPKRRIARAKRHIRNLDARIEKFFKNQPYARVIEPDADGIDQLYKIKLTKPLPESLTDLSNEIVEGLRSGLDQAAFATAVADGKINAKSAYFPIADDVIGLETGIKGRCKDIPSDIITLFRSFNPYKGGNDLIWALNQLCNRSKHRFLTAEMAVGRMYCRSGFLPAGTLPIPRWDSAKDEMVFGRVGPDGEFKYDIDFSFFVALGEMDIVGHQPAVPVFDAMASEVERIVLAIEAEARRIGLI
jgi:hypothetical protein